MNELVGFFQHVISGFQAMSVWEYSAVVLSIAYMLLAMKQSAWCWVAGGVSTLIYTLLFFNGALLMESLLNFFYMAMAVYGWWQWRQGHMLGAKLTLNEENQLPISSWSLHSHAWLILITSIVAVAVGYVMEHYTYADFAYLDSLTTCFGVVATYLLAKKVLENWLYWVVIDAASIYLYVNKGYFPTVVLFVFYTVLAAVNYLQWRKSLLNN
ncbi:nicotinamide riboside transporter PnuC [Pseudoalteromonas byunsanensis]|uniref:Nicotinamide riboside transporter PnuC n=1 Tax=Pseudoalteromonas byunsanensis TaxID=327939 RepID=A0A1S1MYK8_9GAMM|nr:nicotinamide riboside transporter PnuC [Pseudoalteromonas byunsanensis]OHU94010.1 nicotinamide mononucleotide transporter [Pseudoalteromonas byunsanensis]